MSRKETAKRLTTLAKVLEQLNGQYEAQIQAELGNS